jgi:hypothetical protein
MTYRNPRPYCYSVFYGRDRKGIIYASDTSDAAHLSTLTWGYCPPSNRRLVRIPSQDRRP